MKRCLWLFLIPLILNGCGNLGRRDDLIVKTLRQGPLFFLPSRRIYAASLDTATLSAAHLPFRLGDYPEWSPDGKWVAFNSTVYGSILSSRRNAAIYIVGSEGGSRKRVTDPKGFTEPTWSPDGTHLAFCQGDSIYLLEVECVLDAKSCGSKPAYLTQGFSPDWSPSGDQILYVSPERHIAVVNVDRSSDPVVLTPDLYGGHPKWSPAGDRIVFAADSGDHADLFMMKADGSGLTNLTNGQGSSDSPDWSPDGTKIAFVSNRDDLGKPIGWDISSSGLFVMDPDGTNVVRLNPRGDEKVLWFSWVRR